MKCFFNKYQPISLITNQELITSRYTEFYRVLLSVTQEVISNRSKVLSDLSAQIEEDVDNMEAEFSRSHCTSTCLSPLNATREVTLVKKRTLPQTMPRC